MSNCQQWVFFVSQNKKNFEKQKKTSVFTVVGIKLYLVKFFGKRAAGPNPLKISSVGGSSLSKKFNLSTQNCKKNKISYRWHAKLPTTVCELYLSDNLGEKF